MCGLAGLFTSSGPILASLEESAARMIAPIRHRGPDDFGLWADAERGIALGFRRLSIVDLSANGHQPMMSVSGRFMMVFNGEVFNHAELRQELQAHGVRFRGHSDSEVMLAAFEAWGIEASVGRFVGMFAIAVWDKQNKRLTLIRDRLGIKPLFVYAEAGYVSFGSELKALVAGPRFDRTVDQEALGAYLRYLYVPAPRTIYARAIKLLPGHCLTISNPAIPLPTSLAYWSVEDVAHRGASNPFTGSDTEAIDSLEALLSEAVALRMQADVPLGALLSGGVDSSTVVGLMQKLGDRPTKTFTIGFDAAEHDESEQARAIAQYLGTDHTELHLTGKDALGVVPGLAEMYDEPLADPSQIPTYLVSKLARTEVTVALSGDGGDELFAGYNRYVQGERMINGADRWPRAVRRLVAAGLTSVGPEAWDRVHRVVSPVLPSIASQRLAGGKLIKVGKLLAAESHGARYRALMSAWQHPEMLGACVTQAGEADRLLAGDSPAELLRRMMLADQATYLPDDLLAKVDRASMAVSLEARVPLLDHRVVEFSWRLPRRMLIRESRGKWILRQVLYRLVPPALVDRPKVGFTVPIETWLRGPLRIWGQDLMTQGRRGALADLNWTRIEMEWKRFLMGNGDSATGLWAILQLVAWEARWC